MELLLTITASIAVTIISVRLVLKFVFNINLRKNISNYDYSTTNYFDSKEDPVEKSTREYDKQIVKDIDEEYTKSVKREINWVSDNLLHSSREFSTISNFHTKILNEGTYKPINKDLQECYGNLLKSYASFLTFLSGEFFPLQRGKGTYVYLRPDSNPDRHPEVSMKKKEVFDRLLEQLDTKRLEIDKNHRKFNDLCKEIYGGL